jgi:site-specific DNA-methyltransferase (adenine-specific)
MQEIEHSPTSTDWYKEPFLLWNQDCMEVLPQIKDGSINMILADLPFGCTKAKHDVKIPFKELWEQYNRVIAHNGAIVLFGQGMFSAELMVSNKKYYRYSLVWQKGKRITGFLNAKKMPLKNHEDILVFYKKLPVYNPIFTEGEPLHSLGHSVFEKESKNSNYGKFFRRDDSRKGSTKKYPKSILNFEKPHPPIHPTEKPVPLLEWLVKTYTNSNDLVMDNCMGIGTTGIACIKNNRRFFGIEKDEYFCSMAISLITKEYKKPKQMELF